MVKKFIIFLIVIFVVELLAFRGLLKLIEEKKLRRKFVHYYWGISILLISVSIGYYIYNQLLNVPDFIQFRNFFNISSIYILNLGPKIILSLFSIIDDIIVFLIYILRYILNLNTQKVALYKVRKIFLLSGLVLALCFFGEIIYGITAGKADIDIKQLTLTSEKIPQSFDGFKIAQISDLHLGSFKDKQLIENAIALLIAQKPDVIVFTGDMVNNEATEAIPYIPLFKKLTPPYGMYSILGNHDMGDYRRWYNDRAKNSNLEELISVQKEMGFEMLRNKNKYFVSGTDSIALIGVDNWGVPPFKKYGDLNLAMKGVPKNLFKILLSHDPSHWNNEVTGKTNIDLTLAGHTHGAQMVFKVGNFKFSPVQLKYPQWCGLYSHANQYLYVNTGLGFIGFSGRIGIRPEITIITLKVPSV